VRRYRIYQVDAFTTEKMLGNPAGVVPDADGLSEPEMQAVARELNNSETAFILSPTADDHEVWVRFFTPTTEVPSCGHATIAAHYVRAIELSLPTCRVGQKIGAGILPVDVVKDGGGYRIVMTQGAIEFEDPLAAASVAEIISAMGLEPGERDERCPVQVVSTGHSKVMVGIRSRTVLDSLTPDLTRLAEISRRIGCNGYYVFTLEPVAGDVLAHGRMFAPAIGIPEDPVTGNANGPLGAYLIRHGLASPSGGRLAFRARQGEALGRPGTVEVEVDVEAGEPRVVRVAGRAVVAFQTELEL
jgi:PhzF family phenazine biosynthesis protein